MISYKDPLFIQMNTDSNGNRLSTEVLNEQIKVIGNTTFLSCIPDEYYRVNIDNTFIEIDISQEITLTNQFKCNYQTGQLWFHSSRNGNTFTVTRYYSYGVIFYPSSRIYNEVTGGVVTETLKDVISVGKLTWKTAVTNYSDIAVAYPLPESSWTVQTTSDKKIYRYDGSSWIWIQTGGGGTGDMSKSTYDPQNISSDSFDRTNHTGTQFASTISDFSTAAQTAAPAETTTTIGTLIDSATAKTTPVDADMIPLMDSVVGNITKKLSWANIKSNILSYLSTATGTFSNKTLTAPKIVNNGYIADENGNEQIKFLTTASAVNETTIINASAGNAPTISATGSDTNINLNLVSKGAGVVQANGYDILTTKTGTDISPTVVIGMNSVIKRTNAITEIPKFTMTGKSYVNLLGKDGNCDDISKFTPTGCSLALDTSNKVFGLNGIKQTLTTTAGNAYKDLFNLMSSSKYYMLTAYLKNGNATNILAYLYSNGTGQTSKPTATVTSSSGFTRVIARYKPSDWGTGATWLKVEVDINGTSTQYAHFDGIMVNEYPASDDALTDAQLLDKYPYIDSYACLQNPYIEVRHDNLVRNGNGEEGIAWWTANGTVSNVLLNGGYFTATANQYSGLRQTVQVKPNTDYYLSATLGANTMMNVVNSSGSAIRYGVGTFNTGANTSVGISAEYSSSGSGTISFNSVTLIEGTSAPASYKPCRIERCVIEGKFTSDDTVTLENGEVTGLQWWKHRTLYGKDYDWSYVADYAGFKSIQLGGLQPLGINGTNVSNTCIKYDGKVMLPWNATNSADRHWHDANPATFYYLTVADTDTGWAEAIAPNADEVKAFMNGWRTVYTAQTRYSCFVNIMTSGANKSDWANNSCALSTVAYTSGQTTLTVDDGTIFKAGDLFSAMGYTNALSVTSVSGNVLTIPNMGIAVPIGSRIIRLDNTSTDLRTVTYCKNNVAPNYEGYQLHYKLQNPEPITDANTHVHGDIPKLDNGDNYLYLDYGMVLGEIASPQYDGTTNYCINSTWAGFTVQPYLKSKVEAINSIYKNQIGNTAVWTIRTAYYAAAGNQDAYTIAANFDTNATYTVDYQILKTLHTSPSAITFSYYQDILNALCDINEILESKQNKDSAIDSLIDLSMYEEISQAGSYSFNWYCAYNQLYIEYHIPFKATKKSIPTISATPSLYKGQASTGLIDVTSKFIVSSMSVTKTGIVLTYSTSDSTTISEIKTYGPYVGIKIIADCRGRI